MTAKEALDVFGNFNAFRENPTSLPPHFPEPRLLNEACEVVRNFLTNSIVLNADDIKTIHNLMRVVTFDRSPELGTPEYYNEILKRFNETRK